MKESERLKQQMSEDNSDNDERDCNWIRKIERAERKEKFEEEVMPALRALYLVEEYEDRIKIYTNEWGRVVFYPKAGSVLFCDNNQWIKGWKGERWLKANLI